MASVQPTTAGLPARMKRRNGRTTVAAPPTHVTRQPDHIDLTDGTIAIFFGTSAASAACKIPTANFRAFPGVAFQYITLIPSVRLTYTSPTAGSSLPVLIVTAFTLDPRLPTCR